MTKSLLEATHRVLAFITILVPLALILLSWSVFQFFVLLSELLLDQAADAFLFATLKSSLVDVVVALYETFNVLHLAFLKIALIGVLLLLEDYLSFAGRESILKRSFVSD